MALKNQTGAFRLMRVCRILLGLAVLLAGNGMAEAQIAIYGQGTGADLRTLGTSYIYGGSFGIYDLKRVGPVSVGPDIRGAYMQSGGTRGRFTDQGMGMGLIGVRVEGHPPALKLTPYLEGMVGLAAWRGGVGVLRQDANHFIMQVVGGVDYRITQRFDWRVGEITYGRAGSQPGFIYPITVSTGVVLRFE